IVIKALQTHYESLLRGEPVSFEVDNFSTFTKYLQKRDVISEVTHWSQYLRGFETPSLLPFVPANVARNQGSANTGSIQLALNEGEHAALQSFAQRNRVTLNTLVQGTWSYLLSRYSGREDVLFGVTVSGRPTDIAHSEERVGLYIHTILQRTQVNSGNINSWLATIQDEHTRNRDYSYAPLSTLQELAGVKGDLFDSLLVFENFPVEDTSNVAGSLRFSHIQLAEHTNYLLTILVELNPTLQINFSYNAGLLNEETVSMVAGHFKNTLQQLITLQRIEEIELLTPAENAQQQSFQGERAAYPVGSTMVDLLREAAILHANKPALTFSGKHMSYAELEERSNQLANYLQAQGVSRGSIVPLCLERSFEMVIGLLGIIKSGGAYVPIDPSYPAERIAYMCNGGTVGFVLTTSDTQLSTPLVKIEIDNCRYEAYSKDIFDPGITPRDPLYVIYTSGSTGQPKGVVNAHEGLVNRLSWAAHYHALQSSDVILQKTTYCFDVSAWELMLPLMVGARMVLAKPGGQKDSQYLRQLIEEEGVTVLHFVPGMLGAFLSDIEAGACESLQHVVCSGEALLASHVSMYQEKLGHAKLHNFYGPTEAAIDVTYWEVPLCQAVEKVLIGRPVQNVDVYILDKNLHRLPVGVPGELYIGGVQVALGYLNNPALTAERFITNPFGEGTLYKTGDLASWAASGEIEYHGRIDDQVKIRGYRIELGEIETTLQQSGLVQQNVVIAYEGKLVAYVVAEDFNKDNILQYLQQRLPSYMVPSLMVNVPSIPVTSNGKVDRKALPKPVDLLVTGSDEPRNETEQQLCTIWQDLLGISKVGIHDNFFEVGGDSIVSIQVVSRARKLGLDIKPRDIFQFQTIAQLSSSLTQLEDIVAPVLPLEGESPMLPIQQWFFEQGHENLHHYNQAVLLDISKEVSASQLQAAVDYLCKEHDALRFRYSLGEDGSWKQYYNGAGITVETISVETTNIATICTQVQQGLNIENGPIARVVLLELPGVKNGLFIAGHHLCTDGVSWRILCEDLESYITCIVDDKPLPVLNRTTSYRAWAERLIGLKDHPVLLKEASYWEKIVSRVQPFPVDHALQTPRLIRDMRRLQVSLPAHLTQSLLQNVHQAYSTRIDDILLSALQLTLQGYTGLNEHVVTLESHGREGFGADNSRVIGWFTSMYPVLLSSTGDLSNVIISTKESLRGIPYEGLGYGISKYFNKNIGLVYTPCILFNYLGRLSNLVVGRSYLTQSTDILQGTGEASAATNVYPAQLGVDGYIFEESLQFTWSYNTLEFAAGTVEKLANDYLFHLTNIIRHCINAEVITPTIWDTGLGG
ncbi:non-ribosomal peptide synthetase, partial [Chitinophaga skermanii]|uniref:non-ribosomal peptide synthetase n=1 Tax=Chitinophaga skermanii TaxID=331697 RepID=UPI0011E5C3EC